MKTNHSKIKSKTSVLAIIVAMIVVIFMPTTLAGPSGNGNGNAAAHMTVSYQIIGGGTAYSAPTFNYYNNGGNDVDQLLTTTPTKYGVDASSSWSVTPNPLQGSTSEERWYCPQTTGTTPDSKDEIEIVFNFYHQYKVTFTVNGLDEAAGTNTVLTIGTINYNKDNLPSEWYNVDTGFTWATEISGGEGVRFVLTSPTQATGSITAAGTYSATYQKQYQVSFTANPTAGGSIETPTENPKWVNAGEDVDIAATANSGYVFSSWTTNVGALITFDAQTSSTKATINGPGTVTANFLEDGQNYNFVGFLPPIGTAGHEDPKGFKLGSTIPVKFQLVNDQGNYISDAAVSLGLGRASAVELNMGLFNYDADGQQYIFTLKTNGLDSGVWTIFAVTDEDIILGSASVILAN